jgi:hypothetical protein
MKKGPLGIAEKFYVEQKWTEESIDSMAKCLDRAKSLIEKHVNYCKKQGIGVKLDRQTEAKQPSDLFNVSSQFVSRRGSTVMTENASSMSDDFKKNARENPARQNCVVKIKDK